MEIDRLRTSEPAVNTLSRETGSVLRAFRPGLRGKLLALVAGISLISLLVSTLLLFNFQRRQIIENAQNNTTALSHVIEANLKHAMITVDWGMKNEIMHEVVRHGAVDTARILDDQGIVQVSSTDAEVGMHYSQAQPVCQVCHASTTPTINKTVIFKQKSGQEMLLSVNPLENNVECQGCHAGDDKVLGLLMVETPLDTVQQQLIAGYWRTGFLSLGTFVVLAGALLLALRRFIVQPVELLEKGVREISSGNLDGQITIEDGDELSRLAQSLDSMRQQLRASRIEMQNNNQELLVLNEVAAAVSQSLDLQEVLDHALEMVTGKLGMESGFIRLPDKTTGRLTLRASRGTSEAFIRKAEQRRTCPEGDLSAEVMRSGRSYFSPNVAVDHRLYGLWDDPNERSYILVPLKSKGSPAGTLGIASFAGRPMTERSVIVIEAMANEIGIAIDNAMLLAEAQENEQEISTLYQVGTQVSASLALREVLNAVAEAARDLLNADIGLVGLLDANQREVVLKAAAGMRAEAFLGVRVPVDESGLLSGQAVTSELYDPGQPIIFDEAMLKDENVISFLAVPLERGGQILGLIQVMTRQRRIFLPRDVHLLMRLAHHVVVAIENAQLYRQLRHMTMLEERDRLGREMHDHLAQTLGYMNIKNSIIDDLLAAGQVDQAREGLLELKQATKRAYTDVREDIFNLRTAFSPGMGLVSTLQDYLTDYRQHNQVDARLILEDEDMLEFSPEVAAQLLRIIQEALANVRKHSAADKVLITIRPISDKMVMTVADNGRGFEIDQAPGADQQHYGLQIMRERAESVGGSLVMESQLGQGTRVIVRVPMQYSPEEGI